MSGPMVAHMFFLYLDLLLFIWLHVRLFSSLALIKEPALLKEPHLTNPHHSVSNIFCTVVLFFYTSYTDNLYVKYTVVLVLHMQSIHSSM